MGSMAALPGGAEDYVRDSIESSLGLPVSDRSLRLKLLTSEDRHRLLQGLIFSLEEYLHAAARRIDLLKAESTMNAAGLRRCVQEKEAMATAYNDLSAHSAKLEWECSYECGFETKWHQHY